MSVTTPASLYQQKQDDMHWGATTVYLGIKQEHEIQSGQRKPHPALGLCDHMVGSGCPVWVARYPKVSSPHA